LGSTRWANLSWEAQLASTRQVTTAAALRAARKTGSDRRIPIAPNYHSTRAACPWIKGCEQPPTPMRPTSASDSDDNATRTRRKWGERLRGESMVACFPVEMWSNEHLAVPPPDSVLRQNLTPSRSQFPALNLFDCARLQSFGRSRGGKEVLQ
jgi:hypothetical protein